MKTTILTLAFAAAVAQSAAAQVNPRLDAWQGCWRLEDDLAGTGARMCITPDKDGVRLQTLVGSLRGTDELVIPDGVARPIVDSDCKGTERAEWSADGQRVFRTTEVTCGNETPRTIKSVVFLAPGPTWINVQHVSGEGATPSVRVQRYRRAMNQNLADGTKAPQPSAPAAAIDSAWSVEDVIEASRKLPAEALQGALSDVRQKFNINRKTLVAMDDAGVPGSVIDLMVALTFPQRFIVERASSGAPVGLTTGMGWYDPFMSPLLGAYNNCYARSGYYGYRSYYDMCGPYMYGYNYFPYNSYYRPYSYYDNYVPGGWVAVNPGDVSGEPRSTGEGRVVNGRGYTQIRERTPEPSVPRGAVRGDGSAAGWSGSGSSGSSGSGGVSSSGYSSGSSGSGSSSGSSGGGERTAVPRPPGGGS